MGALTTRVDKLIAVVASGSSNAEGIAVVLVLVAYTISMASAIGLAVMVYMPRNPKTGRSLIFFEDIAAMNYTAFETAAMDMSSGLIERQLIDQIYQVSRVASVKMKRVRWAMWLSLPTVVFGFALLAWSVF